MEVDAGGIAAVAAIVAGLLLIAYALGFEYGGRRKR
jgi:hypothetical protein